MAERKPKSSQYYMIAGMFERDPVRFQGDDETMEGLKKMIKKSGVKWEKLRASVIGMNVRLGISQELGLDGTAAGLSEEQRAEIERGRDFIREVYKEMESDESN